jgi:hypothetical protein
MCVYSPLHWHRYFVPQLLGSWGTKYSVEMGLASSYDEASEFFVYTLGM